MKRILRKIAALLPVMGLAAATALAQAPAQEDAPAAADPEGSWYLSAPLGEALMKLDAKFATARMELAERNAALDRARDTLPEAEWKAQKNELAEARKRLDRADAAATRELKSVARQVQRAMAEFDRAQGNLEAYRRQIDEARGTMDAEVWQQVDADLKRAEEQLAEARRQSVDAFRRASGELLDAPTEETPEEPAAGGAADEDREFEQLMARARALAAAEAEQADRAPSKIVQTEVTRSDLLRLPENALFVLDGVRSSRSTITALDPATIRRMTQLHGAEAEKRYGEAGRSGVVEIRTRK